MTASTPSPRAPSRRYIVGPAYDWLFFLATPLLAMVVGLVVSLAPSAREPAMLFDQETTLAGFAIGALIHAHLVAVFFRSHGNTTVFRRFRVRFLVVPPLLFVALVTSTWIAVLATAVATFWDVWHSAAQTFGFGRIYDRNAGLPPTAGRRLDFWMNQLLYVGPILAGACLVDHLVVLEDFEIFEDDVANFLVLVPVDVMARQAWLRWSVVLGGAAFTVVYVAAYVRLARRGHRTSWLKVWLLASTGLCSIVTWGFNGWGEAFLIMNLFHAVQYLALVWHTERGSLLRRLRLPSGRAGRSLLLGGFLGSTLAYGVFVQAIDPEWEALWALTMVVSLMHFWFDGFVWSVRDRQV